MSEPFQSRMSLLCFLGLLLTALLLLAWMSEPFLLAVFAGQLLALASDPLHRRLLARRFKPKLAALTVTMGVVLLLVVPVFLLGALAARQGAKVAQDLQSRDLLSVQGMERRLSAVPAFAAEARALGEDATQALRAAAKTAAEAGLELLRALPELLLDTALAIFSCFFLLLNGDRFIDQAAALLPLDTEVRESVVDAFRTTAALTLWASLATAAAHCALVGLTFAALGIPAALFACAATFVLAWIPIVGSSPVWLGGGLYLLASGEHGRLAAMCAMAAVGAVIDHALRPLILRGRARIPALLALVAIFGGLRVFGLFGVFLGPVLAAELLTLLELWPIVGRRYGLDVGEPGGP